MISQSLIFEDRLMVALAAVLVAVVFNVISGFGLRSCVPLFWRGMDVIFTPLIKKLNRPDRGHKALIIRGAIITGFIVLFSGLIGHIFEKYISISGHVFVLSVLTLYVLTSFGALIPFVFIGADAGGGRGPRFPDGFYFALARTTRCDLNSVDHYGVIRISLKAILRSFDYGLLVPIVWYILFGMSGAYVAGAVMYAFWRYGEEGKSAGFGKIACALAYVVGLVPSLFQAICLVVASIVTPTCSTGRMLKGCLLRPLNTYMNFCEGGIGVIFTCWGLNLCVGGPVTSVDGRRIKGRWIGPPGGSAKINSQALKRGVYLVGTAYIAFMLLLLLIMYFAGQTDLSYVSSITDSVTHKLYLIAKRLF